MAGLSISGLSSGIDTTSVINSLIAVAAAPQNALKTQLGVEGNKLAAFQSLNSKMSTLQTAADKLGLANTWNATSATSSDASVVATGSSAAQAGGSTTFTVTQLAQAQVSMATVADATNAISTGTDLTISVNGAAAVTVPRSGNSAADVAAAVNSANLGVRASVVKTSSGATVLQFSSTTTGKASAFTMTGLTDALHPLKTAQDALVDVADTTGGGAGYQLSSATNTFADAIPGVTFTVSKQNATATIDVSSDTKSISTAVNSFVSALNDAVGTVGYTTAKGGDLAGQASVTALGASLLAVVGAGTGGKGFDSIGIGLTKGGAVTFDATAFATAYSKDPVGTQSMLTTMSNSFSKLALAATDTNSGVAGSGVTAENATITSLNKQISTWDTKLADQKTALTTKYAAMEAALSKMKSQSSYLTSVFSAMNGTSSSSSSSSSSG